MLITSRIFRALSQAFRSFFLVPYFGFVQGHGYLTKGDLRRLKSLVGTANLAIEADFEKRFSGLIGDGQAVAFAAGRMGFFALMQVLGIRDGDEVVLQGATCSVMVNAVLRTGASPVYADIDTNTFGSSADDIVKVLSPRTRLIVAQHSFGIPCDIGPILELAKGRGIFLLEDCALTVGSKINGTICGNFGDAALFSTDHSKPINTLSGGLVYTRSSSLYAELKKIQSHSGSFSVRKQKSLWHQLILERSYCKPDSYGRMKLMQLIYSRLLGMTRSAFASEDYGSAASVGYPYPARIPEFLAALGILEIERWDRTMCARKEILESLLRVIEQCGEKLPGSYHDKSREIIPLRLAWTVKNAELVRQRLSSILETSGIWFMQPIIASNEPLENFEYEPGCCPKSEMIGHSIVNLPCNISQESLVRLTEKLSKLWMVNT